MISQRLSELAGDGEGNRESLFPATNNRERDPRNERMTLDFLSSLLSGCIRFFLSGVALTLISLSVAIFRRDLL